MKVHNLVLAGISLILLVSGAAWGDAPDEHKGLGEACYKAIHGEKSADLEFLEKCRSEYLTVLVTATRVEKDVALAPASVSLVDRKAIERSGGDGVSEILRDIPGVQISDSGEAGLKHVRIRGEESRRVAVLIDGQEFADQREVGTPILISPDQIERIEVVRGPASVLYGSKAIGGVINIITKKGGYHPVQSQAGTSFDSSANGSRAFASVYGSVNDFDYRFGGSRTDYGDRKTPAGPYENTSFENNAISTYIGKHFGSHVLGLGWDIFDASSKVYVDPVVATTPPFKNFTIDVPERDREKFSLFYDWKNVNESLLQKAHLDAYSQVSDRVFNTSSATEVTVIDKSFLTDTDISTDSRLHTYGLNLQGDFKPFASHSLIAGAQFGWDSLDQNRLKKVSVSSVPKPDEITMDEASQDKYGVYVQDEWFFTDTMALTLGGRSDWVSTALDASTRPGLLPREDSDSRLLGSATLSYYGVSDATSWAKYTQGFMNPSLIQYGTGAFAGPNYVNPNSSLDPETSDNFEVGARYSPGSLGFELSLFHNRSTDYIDHVPCAQTTAPCIMPSGAKDRVYVNIDEARTTGLEGQIDYKLDAFTPYLTLAWMHRTYTRDAFETSDTGLPALSGRGGIRYEKGIQADASLWADLFIRSQSDAQESSETGATEHSAGWATMNAAIGIDIGPKKQCKIALELVNLADKLYVPATENLAAPGRSVMLKFIASF